MKSHKFDPISFSFGALFFAASLYLSIEPVWFDAPSIRWLAAGFLLLLGVLMIATSRSRSRD